MKLIFDIGMYDGSDTKYYLSEGYRVLAVEANPVLVQRAEKIFARELSSGQLTLINAAISGDSKREVTLKVSGDDLGSSSVYEEKISSKNPIGSYTIQGITMQELIETHGIPYYLKVDIEGADRFCILQLTSVTRPAYLSFEAGPDLEELISHSSSIGFTEFKLINQCNFLELSNQENIKERIRRKILFMLGYKGPLYVRRNGRFFKATFSSGPVPWISDGKWQTAKELLLKWTKANDSNQPLGQYDIHAK